MTPRVRMIRPEIYSNKALALLNPMCFRLFLGLISHADRDGRLEYIEKMLDGVIFPHNTVDFKALMSELENAKDGNGGFVYRYEVNGREYLQIENFNKHQTVHPGEKASIYPAPNVNYKVSNVNYIGPNVNLNMENVNLKTHNVDYKVSNGDNGEFNVLSFPITISTSTSKSTSMPIAKNSELEKVEPESIGSVMGTAMGGFASNQTNPIDEVVNTLVQTKSELWRTWLEKTTSAYVASGGSLSDLKDMAKKITDASDPVTRKMKDMGEFTDAGRWAVKTIQNLLSARKLRWPKYPDG